MGFFVNRFGGPLRVISSFCVVLICLALFAPLAAAGDPSAADVLSIMAKVAEKNAERAAALPSYSGRRIYNLRYQGFPSDKEAEMVVSASYEPSTGKHFHILSQQGSKFIQEKVFKRLLASEQEAAERNHREENALSERNYEFTLLGKEDGDGVRYVVAVAPRKSSKFLYRGKIWIDAADYAIVRIEAEPARNPSFWISQSRILHVYRKVGDFWLPAENRSTSHVRLGGEATLTIQYLDYQLSAVHDSENAGSSNLQHHGQ